jgi:hypothetical protein
VEEEERARVDRADDERVNSPSGSENVVRVSLSCGVFINQISYRWSLVAMVTTNSIHMPHAKPDGVERG